MSPEDNRKILEAETPEQVAERMVGQEPERGSDERERAVRAHAKRVAKMTRDRTGKIPEEIQRILSMPHPECACDNPQPKEAHKTVICTNCGGICVGRASEKMREVIAESIRQRNASAPNPDAHPLDSLGRKPVIFNKSDGSPIKCLSCEREGKLVYAGFAVKSRKVFCPTGKHTKIPREAKFTGRFISRSRRRAKA
jgi:hypothetical protein